MLQVKEVENKQEWEAYLLSQEGWVSFFQSWNWGEVQKKLGHVIYRLGLYNKKELVGVCLIVEIAARRGKYFHLRHGPHLTDFKAHFDVFLDFVKRLGQEKNTAFLRMSPLLEQEVFDINLLRERKFRNAPIHNMDAENAWVLDLSQTDEEILGGMRKTTRYLVKKSQQSNIKVTMSAKKEDYKKFLKLYEITASRHKFIPHRGMEEELEIFGKDDQAVLLLAHYQKKVIAGALIVFYGNQAVYHHGASDSTYRDVPAAYLLQWEAIKIAKQRGKKIYNFWGVVPPEKPKHPWQGLTLFKTGFGGRRVNFIHAQDLPLKKMYLKTFAIETIWKLRRGY